MTQNGRKEEFEAIWEAAMRESRKILGEADFKYVQRFQDVQQLLVEMKELEERYSNTAITRLLNGIRPHLLQLQYFTTFITASVGGTVVQTACVWGAMSLLIRQLASESNDATQKVATYLGEIGQRLRLFQTYSIAVSLESSDLSALFDILVQLVLHCAKAIKHFRMNEMSIALSQWPKVQANFNHLLEGLSNQLDHLKELAQANLITQGQQQQKDILDRLHKIELNDPTAIRQVAQLPKRILPLNRNEAFSGRDDLMIQISEKLNRENSSTIPRSVAIWGTGGIGKSQVALEYAHRRINEDCPLVLWIPAETESEITKTFVDAATQIRPPLWNPTSSAADMIKCMQDWLQTVILDQPWLLIFDNVEDNELLRRFWPITGNGHLLVTCRSEMIASSPANSSVEVMAFSNEAGAQVLLKCAKKSTTDPEEVKAAEMISEMLGGLALGIDIAARHLYMSKMATKQFLPRFAERRVSMRLPPRYGAANPYYSKSLITCWEQAFNNLSDKSALLLGVLCFIGPDGIPRKLLNPDIALKGHWSFLSDYSYDDAEQQLLFESLIKINESSETMTIHRLTQEAYYYFISAEQKRDAFLAAFHLLAQAFPKQIENRHMFHDWRECQKLIHHVSALSSNYEKLREFSLDIQESAWAILMADATWFCQETEMLQLGTTLGTRVKSYWADTNSLDFAYICNSSATNAHRRGRYPSAHAEYCDVLRIRQAQHESSALVMAESYSAVGLCLLGLFRYQESVDAVNKALAIAEASLPGQRGSFNWDRYYRNISRPRVALGQYEQARKDLDAADFWQTKLYGEHSHFHGETAYIRGKIAIKEGNLEAASALFQRAYEDISHGQPFHQSVAAARYHQARICLMLEANSRQAQNQALYYLEDSLRICMTNEGKRGDAGESARVRWLMAKIWQGQGLLTQAAAYEAAALKAKLELEQTGEYPTAPDDEQAWDCFCDVVAR